MSENKNPQGGLNLNRENVNPGPAGMSQHDVNLNLMATLAGIGQALEAIAVELQDMKDNFNRWLLVQKDDKGHPLITMVDIAERERGDDGTD